MVALADGADVLLFRTTEALSSWTPAEPVADQIAAGADLSYGKFLSWRGMVTTEPPRRPEPQRVSASAAWRNEDWKFGFVGSRDRTSEAVHLPPSRISMKGGAVDDMDPVDMADTRATIATYTIDRLAYSPSPRSSSRCSTSTAAGGSRSSSPMSTPTRWTSVTGSP